MKRFMLKQYIAALVVAGVLGSMGSVYAAEIPSAIPAEAGPVTQEGMNGAREGADVLTPNDWTYTALQTLEKHGTITDMHGIALDGRGYTREELMPLISDVVEKREQMNDNDQQLALRLYQENTRAVMNYRIERDRQETLEKRQKEEEKRQAKLAKKGVKQQKGTAEQKDALDQAADEVQQPEEKALTKEQIAEKMKNFKVDDSRVKVSGDVRIRYSGSKNGNSKSDARARTELAFVL